MQAQTHKMMFFRFVDFAWPWGIEWISIQCLIFGKGWIWRKWLMAYLYSVIGCRMGIGVVAKFMDASEVTLAENSRVKKFWFFQSTRC